MKCITKTDGATIDDSEDFDLVMQNIAQIILKQQEVYVFILKMKQAILMLILQTLILLNLWSIRLNY